MPDQTKIVRRLRVLEMVGTEEFVNACIERRTVKGSHVTPNGSIREAILGDTNEILTDAEIEAVVAKRHEKGL